MALFFLIHYKLLQSLQSLNLLTLVHLVALQSSSSSHSPPLYKEALKNCTLLQIKFILKSKLCPYFYLHEIFKIYIYTYITYTIVEKQVNYYKNSQKTDQHHWNRNLGHMLEEKSPPSLIYFSTLRNKIQAKMQTLYLLDYSNFSPEDILQINLKTDMNKKKNCFPGSSVVKNSPGNAGDA